MNPTIFRLKNIWTKKNTIRNIKNFLFGVIMNLQVLIYKLHFNPLIIFLPNAQMTLSLVGGNLLKLASEHY